MQPTDGPTKPHHAKAPLTIQEIGELLVKHYKLRQGLFDISVEFGVGFGAVGPNPNEVVPGVIVGIQKIGLIEVQAKGVNTIDASAVNPKK